MSAEQTHPVSALSLSVQYGTPAPDLPRWRVRRWVQRALAGAARASAQQNQALPVAVVLTLRFVDADEGLSLNNAYRGRDYATNVLTFEYDPDPEGTLYGDIVLCVPVLQREATEQGKPLLNHAAHLVVHGTLHALGYDHIEPDEADHMEALETAILRDMGLPDPYMA